MYKIHKKEKKRQINRKKQKQFSVYSGIEPGADTLKMGLRGGCVFCVTFLALAFFYLLGTCDNKGKELKIMFFQNGALQFFYFTKITRNF